MSQAQQFVNIGGNSDDMNYRYKMPKMVTKIEGRGNGIKTVIVNMVDIAKALHVSPTYPTKFFGMELGAQSKFGADERAIVNGAHQQADLANLLNKFIAQFVLCPVCKYPEITLHVKRDVIRLDCAACGLNDKIKTTHALTQYIVKHPPNNAKKMTAAPVVLNNMSGDSAAPSASAAAGGSTPAKPAAPTGGRVEYVDNVEWATDSSKEAVDRRKQQEFAEMTHAAHKSEVQIKIDALVAAAEKAKEESANKQTPPMYVLKLFMLQRERTVDEIFLELKRLQLSRDIDDVSRVKVLMDAVIDVSDVKTIVDQFAKNAPLFKKLTSDSRGAQVFLWTLEDMVGVKEPKLLPRLPFILQKLYDLDVLDEASLIAWHESPPETNHLVHDKEVGLEARNKAKPLIQWLKTQDEEEESDDE